MANVTLAQANTIIGAALAKGHELRLAPLTVVVLDAGGHVVAVQREDRSGIVRVQIATAKAWGGLGMGFGSREMFDRAAKGPAFITALGPVSDGRMIPAPGGVLLLDAAGEIIGAVGISGDVSDRDEECALAGIAVAGLRAATGIIGA